MTKYRLITNGIKYRVQKRLLFLFWLTAYNEAPNDYTVPVPIEFDNLDEARSWVNNQLRCETLTKSFKKSSSIWVPVNIKFY